jgi:nitrate/TMAO reductase-like tetraheme cytochrome c subunit
MRHAIFGCLGLIFLGAFLVQAQPKTPSSKAACLACHGVQARINEKYKLNEENFSASVHGNLECTDCHQLSAAEVTAEIPHPKDIPDVNCTAVCHREDAKLRESLDPLAYSDSVHGRAYLERGVKEVARCWDCHGKHNIRRSDDPESTVYRANIPLVCSRCHEDMQVVIKYHIHREMPYQEYMRSVHGQALFEKGLLRFAAVCTDCHGVHDIKGVGEPHLMAKQPQTCGGCHELIYREYKESIHGQQALAANPDAPLCVDCHGEHAIISPSETQSPASSRNIADTCSTCHARPEIMGKYGIPQDRIATFIESMHGIAVGFGYKAAANCSSCHGVHDIRPARDPLSSVNKANLPRTCGQPDCHPGMSDKIASAKIHIGAETKNPPALFYAQKILLILVVVTLIITVLWFIPGFIRKAKLLRGKK